MKNNRMTGFVVSLILLGVVVAFAFIYNAYVTEAVTNAAYNDREILQQYNNEIIEKLIKTDSVDSWSSIIDQYENVSISIEDSDNNVVASFVGQTISALDVKVQTPFQYHGKAYLIKSSIYLLEDYVTDVRVLVKFIFTEFLIGISALSLLIFVIYSMILRPYKMLYESIEFYDKTGKLQQTNMRGYAGQVYKRFVSMTQNLEATENNQRRIIASISHDIKTPLTSIMGYAEQLQKDNIPEERKKRYLSTVYGKSVEIKELVNEFDEYLSFNKRHRLNKSIYETEKLALIIKEEYEKDLEDAGVEFEVNNYGSTASVSIDLQKIKRVFGNIIANSLKHFVGEKRIIRADINSDKDTVFINVHDNGEGVDKEKLELIFEPLYTSDEGRKVAGLGLSICREIIDVHGGRIYAAQSELGGLQICIELPVEKSKRRGT